MLGILGSFAEFERAIIRERQAEGIALTPEGVEGPVGGADDDGAGPYGGATPGSGESTGAPERSVLVLAL